MVKKDEGLIIGEILMERYRIERKIGTGGMSRIYLSSDQWRKNHYAVIKTPLVEVLQDKWVEKKVKQEAESLARLKHPGIVRLLGHGYHKGDIPFIILEYIKGVPLTSIMKDLANNQMRAVGLFLQIVDAIGHAHDQEIFHRDLKPDNIMVQRAETADERIKLIDFGIARIEDSFFRTSPNTRHKVGTPHYISPNRLMDSPDDRADDIYALGLIAYEMMTGINPLRAAKSFEELSRLHKCISRPRKLNSSIPDLVDREIVKALSLNQANRHSSVSEFGNLIRDAYFTDQPEDNLLGETNDPDDTLPQVSESDNFDLDETLKCERFLVSISPGERFLLESNFDEAIKFYDAQIQNDDHSDILYSRRAMAFLMQSNYENAMRDCQTALEIYSENDFAQLIQGLIYRTRLWMDEAERILLKTIKINPENIEAALVLGDIYVTRGENDKALSYYSQICSIHPDFIWVYMNRGNLHYRTNDFNSAINDFTKAIKLNTEIDLNYFQRAKSFSKIGKVKNAIEDLTEAIRITPENTTYYNERAKLLISIDKNDEALADFNHMLDAGNRVYRKDKTNSFASLIDYLKWVLIKFETNHDSSG